MRRSTASLLFLLWTFQAHADTWPGFRGASGSGVSRERGLPTSWSESSGMAWTTTLPGRGNSSPAVSDVRVFVTAHDKDLSLRVIALDKRSGDILWQETFGHGELAANGERELYVHRHNAATPSPVVDERHVWAYFGTGRLVCLEASSGKLKWKRDLNKDYGDYSIRFGMASSPRLWGDRLFFCCIHKGASYVLALDKHSGEKVWMTPRDYPAEDDGQDGYSTPAILEADGRAALVVSGADHVDAYEIVTGRRLWFSSGLKIKSKYGRILASPAIGDGVVVACSGNPMGGVGRAIALRSGGSGDVTQKHRLWKYGPHSSDAPTPVCYRGRVYMVRDDGVGSCLDLQSGELIWRERIAKGPFRASPVAGDGKVYFLNRDGLCVVVKEGDTHNVVATNELEGTFFAAPAISDGMIFLRGHHRLIAIGKSAR